MAELLGNNEPEVGEGHVPPWTAVGVGFLHDPERHEVMRAVVLSVGTHHGPLLGLLHPEFARTLAAQLVEHADKCVAVELDVVTELPPELRGNGQH